MRAEHVEIDEAVVERRDQRIRHRMREPHQVGVVAGRIDDDEVVGLLDRADRLGEAAELRCLVLVDPQTVEPRAMQKCVGNFQLDARRAPPSRGGFRCNG